MLNKRLLFEYVDSDGNDNRLKAIYEINHSVWILNY